MNILNKVSNWYFTKSALPYWCILAIDYLTVFLSTVFVYTLFHGIDNTVLHFYPLIGTSAFYAIFYIIGFRLFGTYSGVVRYSTFVDIQRILCAILTNYAIIIAVRFIMREIGIDLDTIFLYIGYKLMWLDIHFIEGRTGSRTFSTFHTFQRIGS